MKKVYTIWICMESPTGKSIINHYHLTEHQVFGKYREPRENYDLPNIVMVYLAKGPVRNRMLALLQLLFKETKKSAAEKKKLLQSRYDIDVTSDMEEEMNTMCNLSEGIFEDGIERGIERGEKLTTIKVIKKLWKKGMDISFIQDVTSWTEEQIMNVVKAEMN